MRKAIKAAVESVLGRAKLQATFSDEHQGVLRDLQNLERRTAVRRRSERC